MGVCTGPVYYASLWEVGRSDKKGVCIEYAVLIERQKGGWRAFIPALADLAAEGVSRDEAVRNVQRAAEAYLVAGAKLSISKLVI